MYKQSSYEIEKNLEIAKNRIFKSTGIEPIGFRAPVFSINRNRLDIYKSIEKFLNMILVMFLNLIAMIIKLP